MHVFDQKNWISFFSCPYFRYCPVLAECLFFSMFFTWGMQILVDWFVETVFTWSRIMEKLIPGSWQLAEFPQLPCELTCLRNVHILSRLQLRKSFSTQDYITDDEQLINKIIRGWDDVQIVQPDTDSVQLIIDSDVQPDSDSAQSGRIILSF